MILNLQYKILEIIIMRINYQHKKIIMKIKKLISKVFYFFINNKKWIDQKIMKH